MLRRRGLPKSLPRDHRKSLRSGKALRAGRGTNWAMCPISYNRMITLSPGVLVRLQLLAVVGVAFAAAVQQISVALLKPRRGEGRM